MSTFKQILTDISIIFKLIFYQFYYSFELLGRNLIPSTYLKKNIKGDIVLITGAAGGVGKELVKEFLRLGCIVVCIDISESDLLKLEEQLGLEFKDEPSSIKNRMYFFKLDVSSAQQVKSISNRIKREVGKVDILINNAGIMNHAKLLLDLSEDEIVRIFNVNILSQFWLCREFLSEMLRENKGHIVNVSSVCGVSGGYKLTDYCATKFAVMGFTESLRVETKKTNPNNKIVVSAVCPFHIKTKLFNQVEVPNLKWLGLSMEARDVAKQIVNGILLNKELILIPKVPNHIFAYIKFIFPTKWSDYLQMTLGFDQAMDCYKKAY